MSANEINIVKYSIGTDTPVTPDMEMPTLPEIPRGSVVVVEGRGPIWRYGRALHLLHGSSAAAIAFYDPRLGAVIVASHSPNFQEGQIIDVNF